MYHQRQKESDEKLFDSDEESECRDSNSNLFDLESLGNHSDFLNTGPKDLSNIQVLDKLAVVQLECISIPSTSAKPPPIVNLRQSFTFPAPFKASNEIATQTSQMKIMECSTAQEVQQRQTKRPISLPPENVALRTMPIQVESRKLDEIIGDSVENIVDERLVARLMNGFREPDLEVACNLSPLGVQSVFVQPK